MSIAAEPDIRWMSLAQLADALATRRLSSREVVEAHLHRIDEINPLINAVVTVDADRALASAKLVDELRAGGTDLPVLSGIPMTHKDTHETVGMRTTFGSPIFAENVPNRDALIVARLKLAGVICTGKSNVPEFAAGAHTTNPMFGTTLNPYDSTRSASGSSGGAAAAIACGVQAAGDGSDTGGSLRLPASFNNIVGLRPSNGWIPHVSPGNPWEWLSQPGFMARRVADVAMLMDLCSGPDPLGPASRLEPGRFSSFEAGQDLAGWTIGFAPDLDGRIEVEDEVAEVVRAAEPVLIGLGAQLSRETPALDDAAEVFRAARAYEFAKNYGHLVEGHAHLMKSSLRDNIQAGLSLSVDELFALDDARARLWVAMQDYFSRHDVLVTTTSQVEPFAAELDYPETLSGQPITDYMAWVHATSLISATGCPAISVPAGFSATGLPVGLQIIGPVGADKRVLEAAQAFESVTAHARAHPPL